MQYISTASVSIRKQVVQNGATPRYNTITSGDGAREDGIQIRLSESVGYRWNIQRRGGRQTAGLANVL